ncbi:MAG: NAD-dependent epimerase/dehydratase family protein [Thermosynechococcaceae cyanobacterium MS004]|nr:NAD-dependent epimerase/dehydratase family protein [Thermosynechococcaceae cyanobacterium MS004]
MSSVLITGVTGFLGRYLARQFFQAGWTVVGLGTRPPENAPRQDLTVYHALKLPSPALVDLVASAQPDVCIHGAGRASVDLSVSDPASDFDSGVALTFNLLDALRTHAPHCRVLFLSSAAVYGEPECLPIPETQAPKPISPYGFHKSMSEQLCQEFCELYNLPTAAVRIFSAYGPGLRRQVLWDICQKALTQDALSLRGTGQESRDFIHGRDVAQAIFLLAQQATFEGEVYNLANGAETTIKTLAQVVLNALNLQIPLEFDGARSPGIPCNWQADIRKIKTLGFQPEVPLEQGIQVFAQWCRAEIKGY